MEKSQKHVGFAGYRRSDRPCKNGGNLMLTWYSLPPKWDNEKWVYQFLNWGFVTVATELEVTTTRTRIESG